MDVDSRAADLVASSGIERGKKIKKFKFTRRIQEKCFIIYLHISILLQNSDIWYQVKMVQIYFYDIK